MAGGRPEAEIEAELRRQGVAARHIPEVMQELRRLRVARKRSIDLSLILAGALLCLLSCILTLAWGTPDDPLMLFGLTSLGVAVVFAGLIRIFA